MPQTQGRSRAQRRPEDRLTRLRETKATLHERLDNGYQHLNRPEHAHLVGDPDPGDTSDNADRQAWERWFGFWLQLLKEYERVCDQIAEIESQERGPRGEDAERGEPA
ncbi:MAG: hypothetical protein M3P51_08195 [Chloroflexota bacterium]|nr:hypothetical protein [Chloroflexota bacterium]